MTHRDSLTVIAGQFDLVQTIAQTGDQGTHLTAIVGIVVLTVLGAALVLQKRIDTLPSGTDDREPTTDPDVLTDREEVRRLISENGGRMKQAEIVDAVDWSKAKVSRLLADLEDDGEITKLRLGRENLICLEGHEPPASKSPE